MKPIKAIILTAVFTLGASSLAVAQPSNSWAEQWYRAKFGRPSPTEQARIDAAKPAAGQFPAAPQNAAEKLSKRQLKALIASAETPAEHQRIAQFYESQVNDYLAQSKEHELQAEAYRKSPSPTPTKFSINSANHCEVQAQYFKEKAAKVQKLAQLHEQMAKNAGHPLPSAEMGK